ncbi:hypothetical protein BCR35DRAFT_81547 [Leucosporidium creatinivorum]|uniref:Uncharacterized protein n=1 Tax=Leucosporidium creatinivorum TaxID=106004 RepID=A0A1Y2FFE8_9BASI|nr:hypothetical protein BCR35DRAFT_81547 [Leucosporidium creatinivorum]
MPSSASRNPLVTRISQRYCRVAKCRLKRAKAAELSTLSAWGQSSACENRFGAARVTPLGAVGTRRCCTTDLPELPPSLLFLAELRHQPRAPSRLRGAARPAAAAAKGRQQQPTHGENSCSASLQPMKQRVRVKNSDRKPSISLTAKAGAPSLRRRCPRASRTFLQKLGARAELMYCSSKQSDALLDCEAAPRALPAARRRRSLTERRWKV